MTLVWTDPPASPAARVQLVNDLDLMVVEIGQPPPPPPHTQLVAALS